MSFARANTLPTSGFRPYGRTYPHAAAHLSGLGDVVSDYMPQFLNVEGQLRTANAQLQQLEQQYAASGGALGANFGAQLNEARAQYQTAAETYLAAYTAVFGSEPADAGTLMGLGIAPIVGVAAGVAVLAVVIDALYTLNQYIRVMQQEVQVKLVAAQTQQQAQASAAALDEAAQQAYASGDTATGDALAQQANAARNSAGNPEGSTDVSAWVENNFGMIALAIGGIVIAPSLVSGIFGRRR